MQFGRIPSLISRIKLPRRETHGLAIMKLHRSRSIDTPEPDRVEQRRPRRVLVHSQHSYVQGGRKKSGRGSCAVEETPYA